MPDESPGVYAVALTRELDSLDETLAEAPIDRAAVERWVEVRPELRLDERCPMVGELVERLAGFWLPDEAVLYVGLAGSSLATRVNQYYRTPIGARAPHAGGYFLKTLMNLDELHVHYAPCRDTETGERKMLRAFCAGVSTQTQKGLHDPERPFPFANLEFPKGVRKRHGISGARESRNHAPRRGSAPSTTREHPGRRTMTGQPTLHDEIARILREHGNRWMTTSEIADEINRAGNYKKKDRSAVTAFQIHGRTRNYSHLFERDGSRVRLRVA